MCSDFFFKKLTSLIFPPWQRSKWLFTYILISLLHFVVVDVVTQSLSHVLLFATSWTAARQLLFYSSLLLSISFPFLQRDPDIIYEILFPSYFFLLTCFSIHWNCGLVCLKITNEKEKSLFLTFRGLGHENHSFGSNVRVQRAGESICAVYWTRKGNCFFFPKWKCFYNKELF